MSRFGDAIEKYCQYLVENHCEKCAFYAPCNLVDKEKTPDEMGERDIDLLFYAALHFYEEMGSVLKAVEEEK